MQSTAESKGQALVVNASLRNTSDTPRELVLKEIKVKGSDGSVEEAVGLGGETGSFAVLLPAVGVGPGDWKIRLLFLIPKESSDLHLYFMDLPPVELPKPSP